MLRCYDKVRELREATHKQEVFARLWCVSHFDDLPVTRVEYQLRRPVLTDFKGLDCACGLTRAEDPLHALASLWPYLLRGRLDALQKVMGPCPAQ